MARGGGRLQTRPRGAALWDFRAACTAARWPRTRSPRRWASATSPSHSAPMMPPSGGLAAALRRRGRRVALLHAARRAPVHRAPASHIAVFDVVANTPPIARAATCSWPTNGSWAIDNGLSFHCQAQAAHGDLGLRWRAVDRPTRPPPSSVSPPRAFRPSSRWRLLDPTEVVALMRGWAGCSTRLPALRPTTTGAAYPWPLGLITDRDSGSIAQTTAGQLHRPIDGSNEHRPIDGSKGHLECVRMASSTAAERTWAPPGRCGCRRLPHVHLLASHDQVRGELPGGAREADSSRPHRPPPGGCGLPRRTIPVQGLHGRRPGPGSAWAACATPDHLGPPRLVPRPMNAGHPIAYVDSQAGLRRGRRAVPAGPGRHWLPT